MSSNKIRPNNFTPASLSKYRELVFCVPIYQRLFAWEKKQIEKLLDDLLEAYKKGTKYYLGILTIADRDSKLELIDGQQRMVVTTLMAIAFKELLGSDSNEYWSQYLNDGKRLVFSARDEDTSYFSLRVKCEIREEPKYKNLMMENGIKYIKSWCEEKFQRGNHIGSDKKEFDSDKCTHFVDYVWENLTFFCSYLPAKYVSNPIELNRYFEAMNSTGRQLQQHEILLVDLISGHPKSETLSRIWGKVSDVNKRYIHRKENETPGDYCGNYDWMISHLESQFNETNNSEETFLNIEQIFPKKSDSRANSPASSFKQMIISFEELLLMALRITTGGEHTWNFYKREHLLARFQEANLKGTGKIDVFFETLLQCRLLLDYKVIWRETDGIFYDLLTTDSEHRLEKFQSMLYVANYDSFYRWIPEYIQWLLENPLSTSEKELHKLKEIDRNLYPPLKDEKSLCYPVIDRYWFWRLDYELWNDRKNKDGWLKDLSKLNVKEVKVVKEAVERYVFRVNRRSIEHLHPQTPTDGKSEKWIGDDLNRFGNLAMISPSFNSLQSNESAGVKMERVHHQIETSQLQSLKLLHMWITYRSETDSSKRETWTKDKVELHEKAMLSYLESFNKTPGIPQA